MGGNFVKRKIGGAPKSSARARVLAWGISNAFCSPVEQSLAGTSLAAKIAQISAVRANQRATSSLARGDCPRASAASNRIVKRVWPDRCGSRLTAPSEKQFARPAARRSKDRRFASGLRWIYPASAILPFWGRVPMGIAHHVFEGSRLRSRMKMRKSKRRLHAWVQNSAWHGQRPPPSFSTLNHRRSIAN
jgi:hypothetical protein